MVDSAPSAALLDTSVVIALTLEGRSVRLESFGRLLVSSITYAELRLGIAVARTSAAASARAGAFEEITSIFGAGLAFDDEAAAFYGRILQIVALRDGQPRAPVNDRMIAAVAAANDIPLLTLNPAGLNGLESLVTVIDPGD